MAGAFVGTLTVLVDAVVTVLVMKVGFALAAFRRSRAGLPMARAGGGPGRSTESGADGGCPRVEMR